MQRLDGCGIAFASLFKAFNTAFGNRAVQEREINTFEAPALCAAPALSPSTMDDKDCTIDHSTTPTHPICWSIDQLDGLFASLQRNLQKQIQEETLGPLAASMNNNDEEEEEEYSTLPARAQASLIKQSFDLLLNTLQTKYDQIQQDTFAKLNQFVVQLLTPNETTGVTSFELLLQHSNLDVPTVALQFMATIITQRPDLVEYMPFELFAEMSLQNAQLRAENYASVQPLDALSYQLIDSLVGWINEQQQQ
eukprot:UN01445